MNAPLMPAQWIDRLFARLSAIYGNRMTTMWGDCPKADIIDAWGEALGKVDPEHVRMALGGVMQAHPEWPPTLGEFMKLCQPAPIPAAHRSYLPPPLPRRGPIDPAVKAEIARAAPVWQGRHPKQWARDIIDRQEGGERLLPIQIQFAREALGLDVAERAAIQGEAV